MSWNYKTSRDRIKAHLDGMGEIEVEKLVREADLYSLLSETCCREIFGAHVYVDLPNFNELATDVDGEEYRRIVQAVHIYNREVSRIVEWEDLFDGVRVHFQGPRLHALFFRPIDDATSLSAKSVLLQLVVRDFVRRVFNPGYPTLTNLRVSGGADLGNTIGTQDGMRGDRELLFVGAAANHAAHLLGDSAKLRLTAAIFDELPDDLQKLCSEDSDGNYSINPVDGEALVTLTAKHGILWDPKESSDRLAEDKRLFPLKDIEYSNAEVLIDLSSLGINNNKRVQAVSLFADVDRYTRYIDSASTDEEKKAALRVLHAIRKEMAAVVRHDFNGVRVQYQGDRVQALYHLPKDDKDGMVQEAIEASVGLQSSMETTIKECLPEACELGLAIGLDVDTTLVTQLGIRGGRDPICIGIGVQRGAASQEKCRSQEIALTPRVYSSCDSAYQNKFLWDEGRNLYVATSLTADKVERLKKAALYSGSSLSITSSRDGVNISQNRSTDERRRNAAGSWCE